MALTPVETEAIILQAATESLDELVSHELFDLSGADPETQVVFKDSVHQRLFNILLVDVTSALNAAVVGKSGTMLEALGGICTNPLLGTRSDAAPLREAVDSLERWLTQEVTVPVWFPTIDTEGALRLSRLEFIYICGNIAKHGFARLNVVAKKLVAILERNGVTATLDEALSIMEDFYERFHTDIFTYHGTTMAEMLNNVRWAIHEYLSPEYHRSLVSTPGEDPSYSYQVPTEVVSKFGRECYWNLMNTVRAKPPVRRFIGTKWLKLRY